LHQQLLAVLDAAEHDVVQAGVQGRELVVRQDLAEADEAVPLEGGPLLVGEGGRPDGGHFICLFV
jgi:hypothetical protein